VRGTLSKLSWLLLAFGLLLWASLSMDLMLRYILYLFVWFQALSMCNIVINIVKQFAFYL
jgi:hypothetical protein